MEFLDRWLAETAAAPPERPLVTLSYAQSLDGSISVRRDEPLGVSSKESQTLTHHLRAAHDAILVGIGTVLADDPQLTVRMAMGENPQVVVLDSTLRFPLSAKLLQAEKKPWIFCTKSAPKKKQMGLEAAGAKIERQDSPQSEIDLPLLLARLKNLGIQSLMVEGGGEIIASFLSQGLVDRMMLTIAPMFVGGYKIKSEHAASIRLTNLRIEKAEEDIIIFGSFAKGE